MAKALNHSACRREIVVRIRQIRPDSARRWGRMTAPQMICHLRDAFLGVMGDLPMAIPPGFSWWRIAKPFAFYSPFPWPHEVPTRPEFDQVAAPARRPPNLQRASIPFWRRSRSSRRNRAPTPSGRIRCLERCQSRSG